MLISNETGRFLITPDDAIKPYRDKTIAVRMLQKNELVIEEDGKYLVHDVLLARWLESL